MNSSFLENECSELSIPNPLMGRRKFCTSITQLEDRFLSDLDQSFKSKYFLQLIHKTCIGIKISLEINSLHKFLT